VDGGGRLGSDVAFQLFAVFEGHDVGMRKSGAARQGINDRLVAAQFHGNAGLDKEMGGVYDGAAICAGIEK
jgi:hypothetical protein